jgi:hypothetical protein
VTVVDYAVPDETRHYWKLMEAPIPFCRYFPVSPHFGPLPAPSMFTTLRMDAHENYSVHPDAGSRNRTVLWW